MGGWGRALVRRRRLVRWGVRVVCCLRVWWGGFGRAVRRNENSVEEADERRNLDLRNRF